MCVDYAGVSVHITRFHCTVLSKNFSVDFSFTFFKDIIIICFQCEKHMKC